MKSNVTPVNRLVTRLMMLVLFSSLSGFAVAQIPPPGYDREMQLRAAQKNISPLERDSVTLTDTIVVVNPETFEETTMINISRYSIKDYCKVKLGMNNPDILLDRQQHTITDPRTYEDMIIRLNNAGNIDTIPK